MGQSEEDWIKLARMSEEGVDAILKKGVNLHL